MDDAIFAFEGDLTIYQVQDTRDRLRAAWSDGVRQFDARELSNLDGSGAQLLVSLVKTAQAQNEPIQWMGWSAEAQDVLKLLGMHKLFQLGPNT